MVNMPVARAHLEKKKRKHLQHLHEDAEATRALGQQGWRSKERGYDYSTTGLGDYDMLFESEHVGYVGILARHPFKCLQNSRHLLKAFT